MTLVSTSSDSVLATNRPFWSRLETTLLFWIRALCSKAKTPILPDSQRSVGEKLPIVALCWPRTAGLWVKWLLLGLRFCLFVCFLAAPVLWLYVPKVNSNHCVRSVLVTCLVRNVISTYICEFSINGIWK